MINVLYVAIGGAVGATLRYGISTLFVALFGKSFPFATLFVNVVGSFLMGLLFSALEHGIISDLQWRSLLGIGFLGALTTFSTFSLDTVLLLQQGAWFKATGNIVLNVVVCIFAVWLGIQAFHLKNG